MKFSVFKNKKIIWIVISVIVVFVVLNIFFNSKKTLNMERIAYKTETQPLIDRFGKAINVESCFWKAGTTGKTVLGPSSYWMKGFIKISREDLMEIQKKYPLTKTEICFEKGISPDITGFSDFDWHYNKNLSHDITGGDFIGEFYLDINNGVFYFDAESN